MLCLFGRMGVVLVCWFVVYGYFFFDMLKEEFFVCRFCLLFLLFI